MQKNEVQPIPPRLKNAHLEIINNPEESLGYQYSHKFSENISPQTYWYPPETFYQPGENGSEVAIKNRLQNWQKLKKTLLSEKIHQNFYSTSSYKSIQFVVVLI